MTKKNPTVGVIGAGISGLSLAYSLAKKGIAVDLFEQSDKVGGAIRTVEKDGWRIEEGPNTLMVKDQKVWDLLNELNLETKVQEANTAAQKRFVVKNGSPVAIPMSVGSLLSTPLISASAKLRLLKEPFVAASDETDESVASFIERRLGLQPLDYGVNPFVSGIYAGDPDSLSIKHTFSSLWEMEQKYGSITQGLIKRDRNTSSKRKLVSFDGGIQSLPKALAEKIPNIHLSTTVTSIEKKGRQWVIKASGAEKFESSYDCLISTVPTHILSNILPTDSFHEIADVPYAPMSVLGLGFEKRQIKHSLDGFGMLIPEVENYNLLGCLFSSTLFPGRAPDEHHLLTCFLGGARNPGLASRPPEELRAIALKELDQLLGINGEVVFSHHKYWEKAIPQYEVGYDRFLSLMNDMETKNPGLFLEGNYRSGVSVPDCITNGIKTAHKVQAYLASH